MTNWSCALGVLPLLLLAGCEEIGNWGDSERFKEDFHSSYALNPGGTLTVENFNGSVEISGWDQNSVEVNATKYASSKEQLDAIKIDVAASPGSVRIRTVRPSSDNWHGNTGARYTIRVPRHVQLDGIGSSNGAIKIEDIEGPARLHTTNGAIHISKLHGELDAKTTNGGIDAEDLDGNANLRTSNGTIRTAATHGSFDASTSNGAIVATLTDPATNWPVKAHSSNGRVEIAIKGGRVPDVRVDTRNSSVTLRLPAGVNARVRANTTHGTVSSDFDLAGQSSRSKSELEGTIGSGGPSIELSSTNGGIRILRM